MNQRLTAQEKQLQQLDSIYEENKLLQQKCIELDDNRISECFSVTCIFLVSFIYLWILEFFLKSL